MAAYSNRNRTAVLLTVLSLSQLAPGISHAGTEDVFFRKDASQFIRTKSLVKLGETWISFSGCEANLAQGDALCEEIGIVEQNRFAQMQECTAKKEVAEMAGIGVSGVATAIFTVFDLLALSGPGTQAALPATLAWTSAAGGAAYYGVHTFRATSRKSKVYAPETYNGANPILSMTFEEFVDALKDSFQKTALNCNVEGYTTEPTRGKFSIRLSDAQILGLRHAAVK